MAAQGLAPGRYCVNTAALFPPPIKPSAWLASRPPEAWGKGFPLPTTALFATQAPLRGSQADMGTMAEARLTAVVGGRDRNEGTQPAASA